MISTLLSKNGFTKFLTDEKEDIKLIVFVQLFVTVPTIVYLMFGLNTYNAYGLIIMTVLKLIESLFSVVLIPVLTLIVSLLQVIAILLIVGAALLIAALYTCPSEESFHKWTEEITTFMINADTSKPTTETQNKSKSENVLEWAGSTLQKNILNPLFSTYIKNTIFRNPVFMFWGFCRIATCDMGDNNKMTLLGVFNTWIPIKNF